MKNASDSRLAALIERLARLAAAGEWSADLNPAQAAALSYLGRANRYSRAPSQVADYLEATRGTVSPTLKGLIAVRRSETDRRTLSCEVTAKGRVALAAVRPLDTAVASMDPTMRLSAEAGIEALIARLLGARGGRSFGLCRTCSHHEGREDAGGFCRLLSVALVPADAELICHEHALAEAA